ncbi:MAG: glycosyltransferase family 9 protein [Planctomycetia bacterium]|nr:glycosyltransferase family 9 protein [Planctomycetia bacterium]
MHIAVILPRWVGDAVMATPLLRTLKSHFGTSARITGVMRPIVADLLDGTDWIDDHVFYDRHGKNPAHGFRAAARGLRRDRPDIALVLPNSLSSAALAFAGGGRRRVGNVGRSRRWLLTDAIPPRREEPIVPPPVSFMRLAEAIGVTPGSLDVELASGDTDRAAADALLAALFPGRSGPLVVLNDNSSNGTSRAWGVDNHAALGRWIADRVPGVRILVHCGPADRKEARGVVHRAGIPAVRGLGDVDDLPLSLSKAVYSRAAVAVSSDSGPRHIAAGFRVPTVALLGPTDPRVGRSDAARCVEIRRDLPCSPCDRGACPLVHHDCMRLITVEEVGRATLGLLGDHAPASAT